MLAYNFCVENRPQITNVNDALIEGLLAYSTNACAAFAGIFYWIEQTLDIQSLVSLNLPDGILGADNYFQGTDPLHIANIPPEHARIAFLEQADNGGKPVAGLSLFRPESGRRFRAAT